MALGKNKGPHTTKELICSVWVWKQDKYDCRYVADSVSDRGIPNKLPSEKVLTAGVRAAVGGPPAATRRRAFGLGQDTDAILVKTSEQGLARSKHRKGACEVKESVFSEACGQLLELGDRWPWLLLPRGRPTVRPAQGPLLAVLGSCRPVAPEAGEGGSQPLGPHKPVLWEKAARESSVKETSGGPFPTAHHSLSSSYTRVQSVPELKVVCFQLLSLPRLGFQKFPTHWPDSYCPIQPFPMWFLLLPRPSHCPAVLSWGFLGGFSASVMLLQVGAAGSPAISMVSFLINHKFMKILSVHSI